MPLLMRQKQADGEVRLENGGWNDIIIEEQMAEVLVGNYNFSKIGKYISNKLHHIHKTKKENRPPLPPAPSLSQHHSERSENKETKRRKVEWIEPTVGSYQVNYAAVDKNVPNCNFHRSTPHFFGQKHRLNEITSCFKDYPDPAPNKQKGLTDLGRMTGREQIRGSVRRNMENPHENRFHLKKFPVLTARAGTVAFAKMSPRHDSNRHELPLPDYECNFQVKMRRLDSHIIGFEKQTSRYQQVARTLPSEDYRTQQPQEGVLLDKTVSWSKQLPREVEGVLPSYMDKSINSRMAISLVNLKTLEMNCSDINAQKRIPRRRAHEQKPIVYREKNCIVEE